MRLLSLPIRLFWVTLTVALIVTWLSHGTVESGNYNAREWHIIYQVWEYHGYDVAICLDDMTFIRGDGPRAGEVCRIILPEEL